MLVIARKFHVIITTIIPEIKRVDPVIFNISVRIITQKQNDDEGSNALLMGFDVWGEFLARSVSVL
jgi:hypothetical protein